MIRSTSKSLVVLTLAFAAVQASAQKINAPVNSRGGAPTQIGGAGGGASMQALPLAPALPFAMNPGLSLPSVLDNRQPSAQAGPAVVPAEHLMEGVFGMPEQPMLAIPGAATLPIQSEIATPLGARGPSSLASAAALPAKRQDSPTERVASDESRLRRLFDGAMDRRGIDDEASVTLSISGARGSGLARPAAAYAASKSDNKPPFLPRRAGSKGLGAVAMALVVLVGMLLFPGVALASTGPAAQAVALVAQAQPITAAVAAVIGAFYGLVAARPKEGAVPGAGEVLGSILRYGILSGAGFYALLDLIQLPFLGVAALGLKTIPLAIATATLGHSAFQGKFTDESSTAADRIMGAFPAVAAALGLGVTALFAPMSLPFTLAATAMSITGVATAVYSALYKPGFPAAGPARMGQGYVLQSLMTGLALAIQGPYALPFALLAALGFWKVFSTTAVAIEAGLPERIRGLWRRQTIR